ncbi:VWA domain-containing protein [Flavimobilis sp. GY10621]|uniref:VWA domain-containing protein n=1 Tax=Flavimobilis rhizosphaerae TaxID=2775421 RepID=A0ABR9DLN3_9MICO|nr:vWA domain-containing protein [Flavimobilis rhizosphaerae]MBD9697903.1 VWA domain-containing protein [Flavimobilis rhizosphaerae]
MRASSRLAAVALAAALVLAPVAAPASAQELSEPGELAMAQIAGCAASSDNLLVSVVVDESGSLRQNDPKNERVDGVISAIDMLADLRRSTGGELEVEMSLSVFAEGYERLVDWAPLDKANAERFRSVAAGDLPGRNRGSYTDYRAALLGAQKDLDAREAKLDGTSCKTVLWFTDGALDVEGDIDEAVTDLCTEQGIVDSLRASHISILALALFTDASKIPAKQKELLRAVAEGSGDGVSCGQVPIRSDSSAGAFFHASDASALRLAFAGISALIGGASRSGSFTCPSDECVDGVVTFPVDRGIAGAQFIVDSLTDGTRLEVAGPDGKAVPLEPGETTVPGGTLDVASRAGLTTATLEFADVDGPHVGDWTLRARDGAGKPARIAADLFYAWGAELSIDAPSGVVVGEASPLSVQVTINGRPVSADWYRNLDVRLNAGSEAVSLVPDGDAFVGELTLPASGAPSEIAFTASASATTDPSGLRLAPFSARTVLPTRLPAAFPTLSPTRLTLPAMETRDGVTGTLTVTGGEDGPARLCLVGTDLVGPQNAGALTLSPSQECLTVAAGATERWDFTLRTASLADGLVSGQMQVEITDETTGDTVTIATPVSGSMARPVDESLRWGLVAGLLAASIILPLILLALGNWVVGRYRLTALTRAASVPVTLTPQGVRRRGEAVATGLIDPDDLEAVGLGASRRRSFRARGVELTHRLPWWPLKEPRAVATASDSSIVVSGTGRFTDASGHEAPVTTALEQSWVLLVDPTTLTETSAEGRLVFVDEDKGLLELMDSRTARLTTFHGWETLWGRVVAASAHRAAGAERKAAAKQGASRGPRRGAQPATDAPAPMDTGDAPPPLFASTGASSDGSPPLFSDGHGSAGGPPPLFSDRTAGTTSSGQPGSPGSTRGRGSRRDRGRTDETPTPPPAGPSTPPPDDDSTTPPPLAF